MAERLTDQQLKAVSDRGGKLLVSAAAGSGKTKVLVDRLLSYLTDPVKPANLDDFLIITYTKAAAAELRGKIATKLSERIAQQPDDLHLQRQLQRLYLTKISTVHSFCADILREYAYQLDISADFRVAEENECIEIREAVMERLLDDTYESIHDDPDFSAFVDSQGLGRDDRQIPDIIFKVYDRARCNLDPEQWLDHCIKMNDIQGICDASQTVWGRYLIDDFQNYLLLQIQALEKCTQLAEQADGLSKPAQCLRDTLNQLTALQKIDTWDALVENMQIDYGRLTFPRNYSDSELVEQIKAVRDACKKGIAKKMRVFSDTSCQIIDDLEQIAKASRGLIALTRKFGINYEKAKKARRIMDFSDLEQKALQLLLGKMRNGPTAIAKEIGNRFCEVMVDEYQDSNAVQDAIFSAITQQRQNCFMVGDVKQSIYQFRLADPGIFLEKYASFAPAETAVTGQGRKVLLTSNFRSSYGVIEAVNHVFSTCMSVDVGGLEYGEDEALNKGIPGRLPQSSEVEFYAIDAEDDAYGKEAEYVADHIAQLLDGKHMIKSGDMDRTIVPEDIVILLRSPGTSGMPIYNALNRRGIRCNSGAGTDLLLTEEIQTLRSLLQVIDNPLQDIPLVAVLMSRVFGFTADDIAAIRSKKRAGSVYSSLRNSDHKKASDFLSVLKQLRYDARMCSLPQLLQKVFSATKLDSIFAALPNGDACLENLQSFYQLASEYDSGNGKTLSRFLDYLLVMDTKGIPTVSQPSANSVSIMSIHKSKGLEFPIVFLCGLSREFNSEDTRAQLLCDSELGLGLNCVDTTNRIRYPSLAKRAIALKMAKQSISEELRVLYVAMTRPRERLIMTYSKRNIQKVISDTVRCMDVSSPLLMTGYVNCPGKWILFSALKRAEAGALFQLGGYPKHTAVKDIPWIIRVITNAGVHDSATKQAMDVKTFPAQLKEQLSKSLHFTYPYISATHSPSKLTATQLKGREKDAEAAEQTADAYHQFGNWRRPYFASKQTDARVFGTALHCLMQHIRYAVCDSEEGVLSEIRRLISAGFLDDELASILDTRKITDFFLSPIGIKLRNSESVLREFKFSVLEDSSRYDPDVSGEQVLLQGVVDCAIIETDGITVLDYKSDNVTEETICSTVERYRSQVEAYADAISKIYQLPIKEKLLYFFSFGKLVRL